VAILYGGSEKGTASVHQMLCQSLEKYYGETQYDLKSLNGTNFESYAGISMACPVYDRSHVS
jgi:hypothetical protein